MSLFIIGCGYVGSAVVRHVQSDAFTRVRKVYALTRSENRRQELLALGANPIVGDWLQPGLRLPSVTQLLVAIPHRPDAIWGEEAHVRGLQNLLEAFTTRPQRIIYLSTTGVYGDVQSGWVTEATPVSPTREGPRMAIAAEKALSELCSEATILRLAGIYGPGRIPLATQLRAGRPLAVPRRGYLNLVHVADIARIICQILSRQMCQSQYVLSDGQPVQREVFYRELARLCGIESPIFAEPEAHSTRSRRAGDKRVDPSRLIRELGYQFLFPDYRTGLANSLGNFASMD